MITMTKNLYNLSRKAYPSNKYNKVPLIRCTINGVDMMSYRGYHAEIELPDYAFAHKMGVRNPDGPRATTLHKWQDYHTIWNQRSDMLGELEVTVINADTKINRIYYDYYKARYPKANWLHNGERYDPIQIELNERLVAVIMPLRIDN